MGASSCESSITIFGARTHGLNFNWLPAIFNAAFPGRPKMDYPSPSETKPYKTKTLIAPAKKAIYSLSRKLFCRRGPQIEAWVFLLCFSHRWTFLFGPVNSLVVLGGLWSDFRNRNHLSEAKWWLRDVVVVMRGWRCRRRKWWNHWKNSSKGCIYSCVRAKWDGTSSGHFEVNLNVAEIV